MIHEIAKELDVLLRAKGVPLRVASGPERTTRTGNREGIVLERDRDQGDSFGPVRSQHLNPKAHFVRSTGCLLRIYAQDARSGAGVSDHERRAETVLDRVLVGLRTISVTRKTQITLASGRFAALPDADGSDTFSGVVYELRFSVDRSVFDRAWPTAQDPEGAARPEGEYENVGNILEVPLPAGGTEQIEFPASA